MFITSTYILSILGEKNCLFVKIFLLFCIVILLLCSHNPLKLFAFQQYEFCENIFEFSVIFVNTLSFWGIYPEEFFLDNLFSSYWAERNIYFLNLSKILRLKAQNDKKTCPNGNKKALLMRAENFFESVRVVRVLKFLRVES